MFLGSHVPTVKALFISPHFDDAVLSCCLPLIEWTQRRQSVLLLTIFTQGQDQVVSADAKRFITMSQARSARSLFTKRIREDQAAARSLGPSITTLHWKFCDASFRTHPDGTLLYPNFKTVFSGQLHPTDKQLYHDLVTALQKLTQVGVTSKTKVYAPLGVGHHVDHVLTYQAVKAVFPHTIWWEDSPYNLDAVATYRRQAELGGIQPTITHYLTSQQAQRKLQALSAYTSQLDGLYTAGLNELTLRTEKQYEAF